MGSALPDQKKINVWPYPRVLAHRGGGSLAPENTLAAIRCGVKYGFQAIEFDVMLSQDCVPMVIHDTQLGRTVKGQGNVSDYSAQSLMALDAGSWFDAQFSGEPIPSLAAVMRYCVDHHIWMNIEVKPVPGQEMLTGKIVSEQVASFFLEVPDQQKPLLSSFSVDALRAVRETVPELSIGYLVNQIPEQWDQELDVLGAVALHANHEHLSRQQVVMIKESGRWVFCYTVNTRERAHELFDWGVDGLCTDRIDLIW